MGNSCCSRRDMTKPNEKPLIKVNKKLIRRRSSIFDHHITKFSNYKEKYEYLEDLGVGSFGIVKLFCDKNFPNLKYAIKTLEKDLLQLNNLLCLIQEVKILRSVDHPNIIKYFETYEEDCKIHIVTEYIPGLNIGEMINLKKKVFDEEEILIITFYILKALSFLHRMDITHRDLKPENILLSNENDLSSVKLIDFGLSTLEHKKGKYRVGSPFYMAPEMVNGNNSPASDMWSLGVNLYYLSTGSHPFEGRDTNEIFKNIKRGEYDKQPLIDKNINKDLINFIDKLLIVDEFERLKSDEAFEDPWIMKYACKGDLNNISTIDDSIISSLKCFSKNNILQKEILFFLAKISNEEDLISLKKAFEALDYDYKGVLEYYQIEKLFSEQNKIKATKVNCIFIQSIKYRAK